VRLRSVTFNRDTQNPAVLNVRRNATSTLPVPEWRYPVSRRPEDSCAVYVTSASQGQTLSIAAEFLASTPGASVAEVRALDSGALGGNVLGEVEPTRIAFGPSGRSGPVALNLTGAGVSTAPVGVNQVDWRWQFRQQTSDPWVDLTTTSHRIYTILEPPTSPWDQLPFWSTNTQIPWIEVVDVACRWAAGATTPTEAARLVTQAVFDLGPDVLEYGCPTHAPPAYSYPVFWCSSFLERLEGSFGRGRFVNCSDCATIVTTFANVLGCDLWQSTMSGPEPFLLNPTIAIGTSVWRTACGWSNFIFHEVGWTGDAGVDDTVFDACVSVDADADPTAAPHTAMLPTGQRFGRPGEGEYRDRLATRAGRPNCRPQPATRQRRPVV
jgi:hypothetical protein